MERDPGTTEGRDSGTLISSENALSRFRKPLVEYLVSGLEENDKWVRILAADMLGCVGDSGCVGYLKPLLADRDRDIRIVSAHAIDMIGSHRSAFIRSESDPCASCMIRYIAQEALVKQKTVK